ncbi:hypothetical protein MPTK1_5g10620 [Marchantia polymorpha subsp. ruderalis]|uniref:Uncharacterized protein n=2 Tax=Marchantia polymorpha TaxID=3197 RepID=A0AAF6BH05_MARPO|nr:hypothetical protein MARPO_0048s0010 [Marchantia polymorpha]BBN11289.1 hypothetical protein Mp_5g10620 [Marchantia polymorpha subsp. ruderalis]|eukprot:PTQ38882.1 hypothetical protein MARPO_0048s0010 [Marchantia polymorpha]
MRERGGKGTQYARATLLTDVVVGSNGPPCFARDRRINRQGHAWILAGRPRATNPAPESRAHLEMNNPTSASSKAKDGTRSSLRPRFPCCAFPCLGPRLNPSGAPRPPPRAESAQAITWVNGSMGPWVIDDACDDGPASGHSRRTVSNVGGPVDKPSGLLLAGKGR